MPAKAKVERRTRAATLVKMCGDELFQQQNEWRGHVYAAQLLFDECSRAGVAINMELAQKEINKAWEEEWGENPGDPQVVGENRRRAKDFFFSLPEYQLYRNATGLYAIVKEEDGQKRWGFVEKCGVHGAFVLDPNAMFDVAGRGISWEREWHKVGTCRLIAGASASV